VWASLFNDRAWDEREWYQVPQDAAGMAILVNLAFPDERANGVAFTGQPSDPTDHRYLINAQVGDEKVVGNDPHLIPEKDLLTLEAGEVTRIQRARSSALVAPGETVLSDDELKELGRLMAVIDAAYPLDLEGHAREEVLLDLEFKVNQSGELKVKQIRPFLMGTTGEQP
jgi:phosphoenolpyruvate synthase/pyruvate phosphate dikinase